MEVSSKPQIRKLAESRLWAGGVAYIDYMQKSFLRVLAAKFSVPYSHSGIVMYSHCRTIASNVVHTGTCRFGVYKYRKHLM
jgi:hypothetical protein